MLRESEREQLTPKEFFVEERLIEGDPGLVELWWVVEMLGPFG